MLRLQPPPPKPSGPTGARGAGLRRPGPGRSAPLRGPSAAHVLRELRADIGQRLEEMMAGTLMAELAPLERAARISISLHQMNELDRLIGQAEAAS
jgi:hypothetical protein